MEQAAAKENKSHIFFFQFENIYEINPYPHHSLSASQPLDTKTVISASYSFQASETSDNFFLLIIANLFMQLFYLGESLAWRLFPLSPLSPEKLFNMGNS